MKLKLSELRGMIQTMLQESDADEDKIHDAVQKQIELIADEAENIWVDRAPTEDSKWITQCQRAADELKRALPANEIYKLIDEIERKLIGGGFK